MSKKLTAEEISDLTLKDISYLAYWGASSDESEFDNPKDYMRNLERLIEAHAQSRLQAIAEEVEVMREETLDTLRICDPKEEAYIRNDSRQHTLSVVLQIIQQHLD